MSFVSREQVDRLFDVLFKGTGLFTIALLGGIFFLLLYNSSAFFLEVSPLDFFTGSQWQPAKGAEGYNIAPLLVSTGLATLGSMLVAAPIGILTAAFLSELAPVRLKNVLKPAIEMLAAVPSVAIGFLGIVLVGPGIARLFGLQNGLNAVNGSILLGVMALPTIITISEDAMRALPDSYKEASLALGADRWTTLYKMTIPAALPGLIAA
jgi:phosphate transport system permease protein